MLFDVIWRYNDDLGYCMLLRHSSSLDVIALFDVISRYYVI